MAIGEIDLLKRDLGTVNSNEKEKSRLILKLFGWFVFIFLTLLALCWGGSMLLVQIFFPHLIIFKSAITLLIVESLVLCFASLFALGLLSQFRDATLLSRKNIFWFLGG